MTFRAKAEASRTHAHTAVVTAAAHIGNLCKLALELRLEIFDVFTYQQAQFQEFLGIAVVVTYSCHHEEIMRLLPLALQLINSLLQQLYLI